MKKLTQILFCLGLMAMFLNAGPYQQQEEPQYYDNAKIVRVRHVEGEAYVKRSYEEGNEEATVNLPLFEKDEIGTTDGRIELYLGRLNYVRLDSDTSVEMTRLPLPRKTDLSLRIISGGIYLDVENLDMEKGIEVQTPDCGVFLLDTGLYRINVLGDGVTEVLVLKGVAEVAGDGSSRNVRENQKIVMQTGDIIRSPFYFYSSDRDSFDSWNEARNRELGYTRYGNSQYLEDGYEDYEYELSRSGRWVDVDGFNGWIPYSIDTYWRPYYHGRWLWHPYYGRIWTSYDSWGWFTHHYGRWHWHNIHGWYWIPAYHWSPAWVSWFWDDYYWGWCPLSWWNRPVIVINNHWNRGYYYRNGIPIHSHSTVVIRKGDIVNPHIHKVALSRNVLNSVKSKTIAYRGLHAPKERGLVNTVRVTNALGRSVVYKQEAIVSVDKYTPVKSISNDSGQVKYIGKSLGNRTQKYIPKDSSPNRTVTRSGYSSTTPSSGSTVRRNQSDSGSRKIRSSTGKSTSSSSGSSSSRATVRSKSSSSEKSGSSTTRTVKKKKDDAPYYSSSSAPGTVSVFSSSSRSYSSGYSSKSQSTKRSAARTYTTRRYESSNSGGSSNSSITRRRSTRSYSPQPVRGSSDSSRSLRSSSPQSYSSPVVSRSRGSSGSASRGSSSRISTRSSSSSPVRSSSRSVSSSSSSSSSSRSSGSVRRKK